MYPTCAWYDSVASRKRKTSRASPTWEHETRKSVFTASACWPFSDYTQQRLFIYWILGACWGECKSHWESVWVFKVRGSVRRGHQRCAPTRISLCLQCYFLALRQSIDSSKWLGMGHDSRNRYSGSLRIFKVRAFVRIAHRVTAIFLSLCKTSMPPSYYTRAVSGTELPPLIFFIAHLLTPGYDLYHSGRLWWFRQLTF